jgi:hypothetical protein
MGGLGVFLLVRTNDDRPVKIKFAFRFFKMKLKPSSRKHQKK